MLLVGRREFAGRMALSVDTEVRLGAGHIKLRDLK
jgi:hypothetical protein